MILYIAIGLVSGIISGMGIGGGVILIPALYFIYGYNQQTAQNINLIYFIPTAIIALITHFKNGRIQKDVLKGLIIFGLGGAVLGSIVAVSLDSELLRRIFGWFLLAMGVMEFFRKN